MDFKIVRRGLVDAGISRRCWEMMVVGGAGCAGWVELVRTTA